MDENNIIGQAIGQITQSIVDLIIYKKEFNSVPLNNSIIMSAMFKATSGLFDAHQNGKFIEEIGNDFARIGSELMKLSTIKYKEEKESIGLQSTVSEQYLTVEKAAERLNVTEEAVRKACRTQRLVSRKLGKSYVISEKALKAYEESKHNRKK